MGANTSALNFKGGTPSKGRKWKKSLKVQTSRKARRTGKRLMEDTPKRHTGGWAD